MNKVPDTEWFSAYLDGELTVDEQRRVEKMLAASPEARQLLEELRALGATLQSLPQQKLDEDLSRSVLEAAAARMLTASNSQGETREQDRAKPATGPAAETLTPRVREFSWHGMLSRRALVWSGIAVAVALMLFFTSPLDHKVNRIAMTDKEKMEPPKPAARASGEHAAVPRGDSGGDRRTLRSSHRPDNKPATALGLAKDAKDTEIPAFSDDAKRPDGSGKDGSQVSSDAHSLTRNRTLAEGMSEATAVPARTVASANPANGPVPGSAPLGEMPSGGIVAKSDSAPRDGTIREKAKTEATKDGDTRKRSVSAEASDKEATPLLESLLVDQRAARAGPSFPPPASGGRGGALGGDGAHFDEVTKAAKMHTEPIRPGALKPAATAPSEKGGVAMSARKGFGPGEYGEPDPGPDSSQLANEASPRADTLGSGANFYGYNSANAGVGGGNGRQNRQVGGNSPPALVVSLDISLAAARQKTFESLLRGLGMVDMQDPIAVRRAYSGGYLQQNRHGEARLLGMAHGRANPPNIAQTQGNGTSLAVTGNAINSKKPATAIQAPAAMKGAENDRLGADAQQSYGGQISDNVPPPGSPLQIVYDIDASSAQVFEVLQQITQKPDTFSPPVLRSAARANDDHADAPSTPADRARQQIDESTQAGAVATKEQGTKEDLLREAESRPAGSGAGTFAMQRKPAEWQEAKSPAVPTRHVRFVLQVVDSWPRAQVRAAELTPATASPVPAPLPAVPANQ